MANKKVSADTVRTGIGEITIQGDLLYKGASDLERLPKGTAAQALTMNSGATAPEWTDAAAGGAWNIIGTAVADDDASLTITGLDTSVYETFAIRTTNLVGASDATSTYVRLGDSGGIDSGASDYAWWNLGARAGSHSPGYNGSTGHAQMVVDNSMGTAAGEVCSITMFLSAASSGDYPLLQFISVGSRLASLPDARWVQGCGVRASAINVTQIQVLASSGNLTSGRMTVWGIAHA